MSYTLVIVESPGKIKKIQSYLDQISPDGYIVKASVGHVMDMSKKSLGFNTVTFEIDYVPLEGKERVINDIKNAAKHCNKILLAMDQDREGEAIAHHLKQHLGLNSAKRITFTEITKSAIQAALAAPRDLDEDLVSAQETRRIVDRSIGWQVSTVVRNFVLSTASMGRVQTVALWLVVERERAINKFVAVDYFKVQLLFEGGWKADWVPNSWFSQDQEYWQDKVSSQEVANIKDVTVHSVDRGEAKKKPEPPFITSSLLRAASKQLKVKPKRAMELAQKLYEDGHITYMRTDNPNLSDDAYTQIVDFCLAANYNVVSPKRKFTVKDGAQEAHEAIRPTLITAEIVSDDAQEQALYNLIRLRTIACQLEEAEYATVKTVLHKKMVVTIDGTQTEKLAIFHASGRKLLKKGFLSFIDDQKTNLSSEDSDDVEDAEFSNPVPDLTNGQIQPVKEGKATAQKTKPPSRYSEASLNKKLETEGLGRPSTYANIIETLFNRKYIFTNEKNLLVASNEGVLVIDRTENHFSFIDVDYTSNVEKQLDKIAAGKEPWLPVVTQFHAEVVSEVAKFSDNSIAALPKHPCVKCDTGNMQERSGPKGVYWRCLSCDATAPNDNGNPAVPPVITDSSYECVDCQSMVQKSEGAYNGKAFVRWQCSDTVGCKTRYRDKDGAPDFDYYEKSNKYMCKACNQNKLAPRVSKSTQRPFWGCTGYNSKTAPCNAMFEDNNGEPDFTRFNLSNQYKCPACKKYYLSYIPANKERGVLWVCANSRNPKKPCNTWLDDADGAPDFAKFENSRKWPCAECKKGFVLVKQRKDKTGFFGICSDQKCKTFYPLTENNEPDMARYEAENKHKCVICTKGSVRVGKSSAGEIWARCSNRECNEYYQLTDDNEPDIARAMLNCPVCESAWLKRIRLKPKNDKDPVVYSWVCRNNQHPKKPCKTYLEDKDCHPDFDAFKIKSLSGK